MNVREDEIESFSRSYAQTSSQILPEKRHTNEHASHERVVLGGIIKMSSPNLDNYDKFRSGVLFYDLYNCKRPNSYMKCYGKREKSIDLQPKYRVFP